MHFFGGFIGLFGPVGRAGRPPTERLGVFMNQHQKNMCFCVFVCFCDFLLSKVVEIAVAPLQT